MTPIRRTGLGATESVLVGDVVVVPVDGAVVVVGVVVVGVVVVGAVVVGVVVVGATTVTRATTPVPSPVSVVSHFCTPFVR
jgi:hypothetical protein